MHEKVKKLYELLRAEYGHKKRPKADALEVLIKTILSQNTNYKNYARAYENLRKRFPTWEALLAAEEREIADAIRVGGLAELKARRIKNALQRIKEAAGELDLDFLKDLDVNEAKKFLISLEGVGPKTAACVLCFSLGKPVFPVDTHIFRICRRLGLIKDAKRDEKSVEALSKIFEDSACMDDDASSTLYALHVNLIEHGRRICTARNPKCDACVLRALCEFRGRGNLEREEKQTAYET
ncbi:MAG TPA: endonuclease III [Methanomicrobia archaeon]|nr:endonuclease III [Methanomicrobia archaeon]HEX58598.1 endonuclease III [Methanomicrobia archaeon]